LLFLGLLTIHVFSFLLAASGADLVIVKPLKNQSLELLLGFIQVCTMSCLCVDMTIIFLCNSWRMDVWSSLNVSSQYYC